MKTLAPALFLFVTLACSTLFGESRVWTSTAGTTMEAEAVSVSGGFVKLKRALDGEEFNVSVASLSKPDQEWIESNRSSLAVEVKEKAESVAAPSAMREAVLTFFSKTKGRRGPPVNEVLERNYDPLTFMILAQAGWRRELGAILPLAQQTPQDKALTAEIKRAISAIEQAEKETAKAPEAERALESLRAMVSKN